MRKKKLLTTCRKRVLCFMLSAAMLVGCAAPASAAVVEQEHMPQVQGVITNLVLRNVKGIALEYLERAVLTGLGKASEATDGTLSDVLSVTKRLLGSSQGVSNTKIINLCNQIIDQLNDIEGDLNETRAALDASINQVSQQISKTNVNSDRDKISKFNTTYTEVLNRFEDLTEALQTYAEKSEAGTLEQTDIDRLSDAYARIDEFYQSSGDSANTQMTFNFYDDLMEYLQVISPYNPATELSDDLADDEGWGDITSRDTFMDHLYELSSNGMAFEHQVYDAMAAGMNEAVVPLTTYLTAYRIYVEYMVQELNSDAALSEQDRSAQIRRAWDAYYMAQNRAVRGIQQMTSLYDDTLSHYMRSYDVSQSLRMDYHASGDHDTYRNFLGILQTQNLKAKTTSEYMPFYVVKPMVANSDVTYAINQWTGSGKQYAKNITYNSGMICWESTCYAFSQDYYNLQKTINEDSGYSTIRNGSDLSTLVGTNAFSLSGYYLKTYLEQQGGLTNLPPISNKAYSDNSDAKKQGSFALLTGRESWAGASADITLLNVSMMMQPGELDKPAVEISTGDIWQSKFGVNTASDPLMVIMKANSNNRTISGSVNGGSMSLYSVDANGKRTSLSWGSSVKSGTKLEIHITPESGKVVDSIKLLNYEKKEIYSFADNYEEADQLDRADDGSYVLTMPMSYQNVQVSVSCISNPQTTKTATLGTSTEGDLQFEGRNGMSVIEYVVGDTVTFYARPFKGKKVDSVQVKAADGSIISCTDLDTIPNTPNEQGYVFEMPNQDVTITATYRSADTVTFENVSHGYAMVDMDCMYEEWLQNPVAYDAGDTVTVKTIADDGYFYCNTEVMGVSSGAPIPVVLTENGFTFTMPEESVIIRTTFDSLSSGSRVTLEDNTGNHQIMSFEPLSGETAIQSNVYHFDRGSTVKIRVKDTEGKMDPSSIRVVPYSGQDLEYTYEDHIITFTMPAENVSVYPPVVLRGSGTAEDPYEIWNYDSLVSVGRMMKENEDMRDDYYILTADINGEGQSFTPIAEFSGQLDGNGYTISNLTLITGENTGLFAVIGSEGEVSNLNLIGIQAADAGGLAGILSGENLGTITNCHVGQSTISGSGILGGLTGSNQGVICRSGVDSLRVTGTEACVGVLTGENSGNLTDCYAQGFAEEGTYRILGGIAGVISGDSPVIDSCYAAVSLTQGGIIAGENSAAQTQVENCYYLSDLTSASVCGNGDSADWEVTGRDIEAFSSGEVTYALNQKVTDGSQSWYQNLPGSDDVSGTPRHDGMPVFYSEKDGYTNHNYINGICEICGKYQIPDHAASDGAYEIRNAGELFWFAQQVNTVNGKEYARLMCDIDLENRNWTPIGLDEDGKRFNGVLDGQGYGIRNLKVSSTQNNQGLFGCVTSGALIKDLGIESGTVKGNSYVGGLVGIIAGSGTVSIERCWNNADVTALDRNAGGILGCNMDSAAVTIQDCYNTGTISGNRESAGISGWVGSNASVTNCYNAGTVTGYQDDRIMFRYSDGLRTSNNYYLDTLGTGQENAQAKTAEQFGSGEVTWLLNGSTSDGTLIWYQTLGEDNLPLLDKTHRVVINDGDKGYRNDHTYVNGFCTECGGYEAAALNADGIYEISNGGQMFWYAALVNNDKTHALFSAQNASASAVLVNDIDLEGREWTPVGTGSYGGTFDGQGYTVKGLSITNHRNNTGLFGYCRGANIMNLTVEGSIQLSESASNIGGVAGNFDNGTISNVNSYVDISNSEGTLTHVGGVVGALAENRHATRIEKSMYYGSLNVVHSTDCIGGVAGYSNGYGTIADCANIGTVSSTENSAAPMIGGVLGYANSTVIYVSNSYNYGTVDADNIDSCGAVIGLIKQIGAYENCYYLEGSAEKGTGRGTDKAIKKSKEEFASGEVAYLLNTEGEITQNRNIWSQGEEYPVIAEDNTKALHRVLFQYAGKDNEMVRHAVFYINGGMRTKLPEEPILDRQKFIGWFTSNGYEVKQDFMIVKDMTITGKFMAEDGSNANLTGSAGQTDGSAGQTDGSAGQTDGSAGQTDGSAGKTDGSVGKTDGSTGNGTASKVKTGDSANMIWLYLFMISGAVAAVTVFGRKRETRKL